MKASKIQELRERRRKIIIAGGEDKIKARHEKGLLTARERLEALFQPETFQETGMHIHHCGQHFGSADKGLPADAVIAGTGYVNGQLIAAVSQDFTVAGGTLGKMHAAKIVDVMKFAMKTGVPVVAFEDSGGARIHEGVDSLSGYGQVFYHNVLLSGVVPQIAVVCGPCAGGAPALMDFVIMTKSGAYMFITGPEVIKTVTGRAATMGEIGNATMHATVSGNVHFVAEDDTHAIQIVQRLLSYLPANNTEDPPHRFSADIVMDRDEALNEVPPDDPSEPMDVRKIIARLIDDGELLEIQAGFARNLIIGFARIEGMVVGLVANQSTEMAGALDINAACKGARFIRFCNIFNIPLVTLVDVPGFLPGVEQERGAIIRHGAKLLFAYASCTTPKISVILRKAYGDSYHAMCSQEMGADFVYAWPSAEIAVMGAEGAINILYRKELSEAADRQEKVAQLAAQYRAEFASPYSAAEHGYVTDVIEPSETRGLLALSLRKVIGKREERPPQKHSNNPL